MHFERSVVFQKFLLTETCTNLRQIIDVRNARKLVQVSGSRLLNVCHQMQVVATSTLKDQTAVWYYFHLSWIGRHVPRLLSNASASGTSSTASHQTWCFVSTSVETRYTLARSGVDAGLQVACGPTAWWHFDVESRCSWCLLRSLDTCLLALPLTTSAFFPAAVTWVPVIVVIVVSFWIRNWFHITNHLVILVALLTVGATRFKLDRDYL